MYSDPEKRMLRRPVVALLKAEGGVDPDSTLAGELRHMGITHKRVPGLFKIGGRGAIDNVPRSENPLFADLPDDGCGYIPEATILEALRDEMFGLPWRSAEQLEAIESYRAASEAFDDIDGLAHASEEMGIADGLVIEAARAMLRSGEAEDPYDALELAVMASPEPSAALTDCEPMPFPEKRTRARKGKRMTPEKFKASRQKLGLSVNQMAVLLGVDPVQVRRMEISEDKGSHRPVMPTTERLVRAYLEGYRPKDWPEIA